MQAWDANTLTCLRTLEGHDDNVRVLAVGHNSLFSGSWDKTVRVSGQGSQARAWMSGAKCCKPWFVLKVQVGVGSSCRGVCCGRRTWVQPWNAVLFSTACLPHLAPPCSLTAFHPGSPVQVWSADTLTCTKVLEGHNEAVLALAVGDLFMASGSYDTTIR